MKKSIKLLILSLIILSSLAFEVTNVSLKLGSSYAYVVKPMIWIFIGIISYFFFKNDKITNNKYKKDVFFIVSVTTLIYFLLYFILGYIKGFANNPYDTSFKGIVTNLWMLLPMLVVKEYVRYYMINNCEQKKVLLNALLISIIFTLVELNIYKFDTYFSSSLATLEFIMQTFIPSLITSLYLTYVCYFAGYSASIFYVLLPQLIMYVLPILPDIDWATMSIINSAIPFFSYIYINYSINKMDKTLNRKEVRTVGIKGWLSMIAIVILMVCFGLGVFPYKPLVIASNSMAPKIHKGDIVIIKDVDVKNVKKGDVVRYKMEGYYVVHRIVMVSKDEDNKKVFITKGDNNDNVDLYPVRQSQYAGVVKLDIPYLGYPTLILSKLLHTNVDDKVSVDKGRIK